uniref:uncharacterized protein LOC108950652 isoform X2 n=1 Tax=Ciona intestinalis TaxID=7719 RepID=UPI000EF4F58E|nr:uncharacterized protein LOC108950652 isoform X2 [Ciona intestinalis]|eukprot:XP_018672226.2 uncharacterized protein LOC108950652 isoform X2 [Ciona intestinalis]
MKVRKALELARLLLLLFLVLDRGIKTSLAGNSAKRAGLVGTNRIDGSSFNNNQDSSSNKLHPHTSIDNFSNSTSATQRLKSSLFARYDKTVMPVVNHSQNVLIRVGFTYRQWVILVVILCV